MSEKNQMIKSYITQVASRVNEQYQGLIDDDKINKAMSMFSDSTEEYDVIVQRINELVNQMIQNYLKEQEKRFDPKLVKENHEKIYSKLEVLIRKLNEKDVDYQLAGALCAYIKYGVESDRTHDDIDINLNESDMNKFKEACEEMGLQFHDKRLTTSRILKNGIPSGEHEVIATLDGSDFHIGAFCFERKPDGTVINKGYYHDENGQIFSRNDIISPQLASEIFGREQAIFRGQRLFITPPEYIYKLKSYTHNSKDKVDLLFMESRIDRDKLARINELSKTSHIKQKKINNAVNFTSSQNFNYHTHTYRSGHSEYVSDEEILETAKQMGIPAENIFILENGKTLEINKKHAKITNSVPSGKILVDGLGVGDVGNIVLRDRQHLSQDGLIVIVMGMDSNTGEIVSGPDVVSRGFVYVRESETLMDDLKKVIRQEVRTFEEDGIRDWATIKSTLKDDLRDYIFQRTKRNPMILPIILEV